MISLTNAEPLARGSCRLVYRHPANEGLLIKVFDPHWVLRRYKIERPWYKPSWRRYHEQLGHLREVREQFALNSRGASHPGFVQKIVGLQETDLGLGLVVEAVLGQDGKLAPTIRKLIEDGRLTAHHDAALDDFCDALIRSPVIFTDLHLSNVVYGSSLGAGERFVLIDGIGFKTLIPAERISATVNRWRNTRSVKKLRALIAARLDERAARESELQTKAA